MERRYYFLIIWTFILFINICTVNGNTFTQRCPDGYVLYSNGLCYPKEQKPCPFETTATPPVSTLTTIPQRCPDGYILYSDGLCYLKEQKPCPFETTATPPVSTLTTIPQRCPDGYILYSDGLCYPKEQKPCPFETTTTPPVSTLTTETLPASSLTTMPTRPAEIRALQCPKGSIMVENKCRKVVCSLGEYYKGMCLHPVCPPGLVWRGKKCQSPGFVTTVLEIDNVFVNELNDKPIALKKSNKNKVIYHTTSTTPKPYTTRSLPNLRTTKAQTTTNASYIKSHLTNSDYNTTEPCCEVITPRICKLYKEKWLCFHRRHRLCDKRICSTSIVYLKAPEIKYEHPVLIMPPNPQLAACETNDCLNKINIVDCSGCPYKRSKNCSPHCYRYMCPNSTCNFMELREYCTFYSGQTGCLPEDGCLWNWC